jgi:hypothetical protein
MGTVATSGNNQLPCPLYQTLVVYPRLYRYHPILLLYSVILLLHCIVCIPLHIVPIYLIIVMILPLLGP